MSILNEAKYFFSGICQNYLVFIPAIIYIQYFSDTNQINSSKSKGMSENNIENKTKSDRNCAQSFVDYHVLWDISFNGCCLLNNNISIPKDVINI